MTRREVKGATPVRVDPADNLTTSLWDREQRNSSRVILSAPQDGGWRDVTWGELAAHVRAVAGGLVALGVEAGDRVALMSNTRLEWTVADLAILAVGGVTVPIYETSSVGQCEWILSDSGARLAVAGTTDHARTLDAARSAAPDLGEIFVLDDRGLDTVANRAAPEHARAVARRAAATSGSDLASLIYTSGTTGNPKGCMLSHRNLLDTARQTRTNLPQLFERVDVSTLLFLPLAHVFARIVQFGCLESDAKMGYARSVETLVADISSFKPTFLLSVPRVFEKVFNTAQRNADGAKRKVFEFAVSTAQEWSSTPSPGPLTNLKRVLADRLVYVKLRDALGGRVRYCVSGGAPLAPHLASFFHAANITILEGYGLTETSAATCVNSPDQLEIGTVGHPNPGTEIRIADDGEIVIRGPGVFQGYWRDEAATREVIDEDGWFHSGDLGEITDDGFVRITGRKKEIIVTTGGKNVAPAVLEERLKAHHLVSQAMVVGDDRPFVAALVTLDPEELAAFAKEHDLNGSPSEIAGSEAIGSELGKAVAHANGAVSKAESIRRITVLDRDFELERGEMTPTLKLRRRTIVENFGDEIERLYTR